MPSDVLDLPARIVEVHPRVYRVESAFTQGVTVMLYVIRGPELTLIDTGVATSPAEHLRPALAETGLDLADVGIVLNTHGHMDHLGGNAAVRDAAPAARVHVHRNDQPFADSHDYHLTFMTEFLRSFDRLDLVEERAAYALSNLGRDVGVDRVLEDGDRIDLGGGIVLTAIHTPGHTPGSVCYYWEAERLLFTGDAVQARGFRPGGYPLYFHAASYRASIERLLALPIDTLCMGHGFHSALHLNTPVKRGVEAWHMLRESADVHTAIEDTVRRLVAERPNDGPLEIARRATIELLGRVPAHLDPRLGLPLAGGPTLWAHIREARG